MWSIHEEEGGFMKFGLVEDFRNPQKWYRPYPQLYQEILAQVSHIENLGYDNVWLTEHHFTSDGYNPSLFPTAAAIAARTRTIPPAEPSLRKSRRVVTDTFIYLINVFIVFC